MDYITVLFVFIPGVLHLSQADNCSWLAHFGMGFNFTTPNTIQSSALLQCSKAPDKNIILQPDKP
jgi:hypothetical protein